MRLLASGRGNLQSRDGIAVIFHLWALTKLIRAASIFLQFWAHQSRFLSKLVYRGPQPEQTSVYRTGH